MKKKFAIFLLAAIIVPHSSRAFVSDDLLDTMLEDFEGDDIFIQTNSNTDLESSNTATVRTNIKSSANTGGNTAGTGENIVTGKERVEVKVYAESNGEGEDIEVMIDSDEKTESYYKETETKNGKVIVDVKTDKGTNTEVEVNAQKKDEKSAADTEVKEEENKEEGKTGRIMISIKTFFKKIFGFFF